MPKTTQQAHNQRPAPYQLPVQGTSISPLIIGNTGASVSLTPPSPRLVYEKLTDVSRLLLQMEQEQKRLEGRIESLRFQEGNKIPLIKIAVAIQKIEMRILELEIQKLQHQPEENKLINNTYEYLNKQLVTIRNLNTQIQILEQSKKILERNRRQKLLEMVQEMLEFTDPEKFLGKEESIIKSHTDSLEAQIQTFKAQLDTAIQDSQKESCG